MYYTTYLTLPPYFYCVINNKKLEAKLDQGTRIIANSHIMNDAPRNNLDTPKGENQ